MKGIERRTTAAENFIITERKIHLLPYYEYNSFNSFPIDIRNNILNVNQFNNTKHTGWNEPDNCTNKQEQKYHLYFCYTIRCYPLPRNEFIFYSMTHLHSHPLNRIGLALANFVISSISSHRWKVRVNSRFLSLSLSLCKLNDTHTVYQCHLIKHCKMSHVMLHTTFETRRRHE